MESVQVTTRLRPRPLLQWLTVMLAILAVSLVVIGVVVDGFARSRSPCDVTRADSPCLSVFSEYIGEIPAPELVASHEVLGRLGDASLHRHVMYPDPMKHVAEQAKLEWKPVQWDRTGNTDPELDLVYDTLLLDERRLRSELFGPIWDNRIRSERQLAGTLGGAGVLGFLVLAFIVRRSYLQSIVIQVTSHQLRFGERTVLTEAIAVVELTRDFEGIRITTRDGEELLLPDRHWLETYEARKLEQALTAASQRPRAQDQPADRAKLSSLRS